MKFGTGLPLVQQMPNQVQWETGDDPAPLVAVAKKADELGYAWVPCSDHVAIPRRAVPTVGTTWYEPATTLSFVAGVTQRVGLLTHVIILPYHNPLDIAKQYATLDRLSGGRVILGVGVGHLRAEFRALHAPYEERGDVTDEYIQIIKVLWTDEEAEFHGKHHEFWGLHLAPRPVQKPHPPIWVGGNSRRAARRAAELGDGWVPFQVTMDEVRDRLSYIQTLPAYEQRRAPLEVVIPSGAIDIRDSDIDGDRAMFAGSREQVLEDIRAYEVLGVTGMTVGFRSRTLEEHIELMEQFAREIMPAFA